VTVKSSEGVRCEYSDCGCTEFTTF